MLRDNKDQSAHRDLPDQEVKQDLQARKVRWGLKVRRVKQEPKDPQVPRASEERQEYRDRLDLQDLLVLPVLLDQQVPPRSERSRVRSRSPVTKARFSLRWFVRLERQMVPSAALVQLRPDCVCRNNHRCERLSR